VEQTAFVRLYTEVDAQCGKLSLVCVVRRAEVDAQCDKLSMVCVVRRAW